MWNKHLQEVIDELVTTIKEMNPDKQTCVLTLVRQKLAALLPADDNRRLTTPLHKWILPPSNPQRVTQIPTPDQRVAQRVDNGIPTTDIPTPLTRVADAPAIMAAPNPTTKQSLWLTPWTHIRRKRNNIHGLVPPITRNNHCPVPAEPSPPTPALTRCMGTCSRPTSTPAAQTCMPHVRFVPI